MIRRKSGIALFITMITIVLLAFLMGAFFHAYRSQFSITRGSNASQAASAACDSVFQYVVYRAEHDRGWGSQPFTTTGEGDPRGGIVDIAETPGTNKFVGTVYSLNASFEGTVYNNLGGSASAEVAAQAKPGTLKCIVNSKVGDSTRRSEFVVRVAPLFDSSVLSRSDIRIDADRLEMRSRDQNRNYLRSEGDIYVPNMLTSQDSQFLLPDSTQGDSKGMLWAKGDIYSYTPSGPELIDEGSELAAASTNTNGKVVSDAESHFSIFELEESNLQLPEGQTEVEVPQGRWNFVRKEADVAWSANYGSGWSTENAGDTRRVWVDVLEYYDSPDAKTPSQVFRGQARTEDLAAQVPTELKTWWSTKKIDPESIKTFDVELVDYEGMDVSIVSDGRLDYPEAGGGPKATFDLENQKFIVDKDARVNIDGPFHLTSFNEPEAEGAAPGWKKTPPPTLELGYGADPSAPGGVQKATLHSQGTLNIENGITEGLGTIVSIDGDVKLQPKDTNSVDVNTDAEGSGLLIYAGNDVVLQNPDKSEDWNFKGLVYAQNVVKMIGSEAEDVTFEGTVVARHKNRDESDPEDRKGIEFVDCGQVEFIYNNDLLDAYVQNLPGQRIQVETVYFKR